MQESAALQLLAALSQPLRLRLFRALVGSARDGMTPGSMSAMLGVPASTLSFHLKELLRAGLVTQVRDGRSLIYRPAIGRMDALLEYLTAHCCHGEPCEARPARSAAACR
jgi:ArsR family transcriptional regulator